MIDRTGNIVHVYWADYELLWLEAALQLDRCERNAAFRDIASMSGRTVESVRSRARQLWAKKVKEVKEAEDRTRRVMVPERSLPKVLESSAFNRLPATRLMSGRASVARARPAVLEAAE